jgi:hypothetical protein
MKGFSHMRVVSKVYVEDGKVCLIVYITGVGARRSAYMAHMKVVMEPRLRWFKLGSLIFTTLAVPQKRRGH